MKTKTLKKFPLSNLQEAVLIAVMRLSVKQQINKLQDYKDYLNTMLGFDLDNENCTLKNIINFLDGKNVRISNGSAYTSLQRLVEKKFLKSKQLTKTNKRGGKSITYYMLTQKGIDKLESVDQIRLDLKTR